MSTEPLDPAAIMVGHPRSQGLGGLSGKPFCESEEHITSTYWPCENYRLAEALAEERARVQRVEAVRSEWRHAEHVVPSHRACAACLNSFIRAALAGDTEGAGQ